MIMLFDVNRANRTTTCRNCGCDIPPKTKKLRFSQPLGVNTVSGSICPKCTLELVRQMGILDHEVFYELQPALDRFAELVMEQVSLKQTISSTPKIIGTVAEFLEEVTENFKDGGFSATIDTALTNVWLEKYLRVQGDKDAIIWLISVYPRNRLTPQEVAT